MPKKDPHARDKPTYECVDCGKRLEDEDIDGRLCPDCGGYLQNIGVTRAE